MRSPSPSPLLSINSCMTYRDCLIDEDDFLRMLKSKQVQTSWILTFFFFLKWTFSIIMQIWCPLTARITVSVLCFWDRSKDTALRIIYCYSKAKWIMLYLTGGAHRSLLDSNGKICSPSFIVQTKDIV